MIIAQISDTHLTVGEEDSDQKAADFQAVIADINTLDPLPDLIIHSGDIVQNGRPEEYAKAAEIMGHAAAPVFVMAGNKDDRENLRAVFGSEGYFSDLSAFLDYTIDEYSVRLLILDTINPGSRKGAFDQARLDRLTKMIDADASRPTAVFAHHPPFEVPVGPEPLNYDDPSEMTAFAGALQRTDNLIGLFSGHVHRPAFCDVGKVPAVIIPSVSTKLRFGDYPEHMKERPIYFVHRFDPDYGFSTETHIAKRWF